MKGALIPALLLLASCNETQPAEPSPEPAGETSSDQSLSVEEEFFPGGVYTPLAIQARVDRSFSAFPIETPLADVEGDLTQIIGESCAEYGECDWADEAGVRHYFFSFSQAGYLLVVKSVHAADFTDRSIDALGIGMARSRDDVVANVRAFLGDTDFSCDSPRYCGATLGPGWIRVWFDENGQLREAQFDGYHST